MDCAKYTGKDGDVTNEEMKKADVVCLYFSAHWCPPCRQFTPVLSKMYTEIKKLGKKLEVIFVSCD